MKKKLEIGKYITCKTKYMPDTYNLFGQVKGFYKIQGGRKGVQISNTTRPDRERNFPFVRNTTRIGDLLQ